MTTPMRYVHYSNDFLIYFAVCPGGFVIESIHSAQELKGCTIIHGPLEININGGSE